MSKPVIVDGWLVVPCDAPDSVAVEIAVDGFEWRPAYRDRHDGVRTAQVRAPRLAPGSHVVHIRTDAGQPARHILRVLS